MSKIHKKKPTSVKKTSTIFDKVDEDNKKNNLLSTHSPNVMVFIRACDQKTDVAL